MKTKCNACCIILLFLTLINNTATAEETQSESLVSLTGIVIRQGWRKSYESWNAGGSDYYVLDVGNMDLPSRKRTAREGVILRPSKSIPFKSFKNFIGQNVICKGKFLSGKPYIHPEDSMEQTILPMENPLTGKIEYPIRGSGFKVYEINVIDEVFQTQIIEQSTEDIPDQQVSNQESVIQHPDETDKTKIPGIIYEIKGLKPGKRKGYLEAFPMQHLVINMGTDYRTVYLDIHDVNGKWCSQIILLFPKGALIPSDEDRPFEVSGDVGFVETGGRRGTMRRYCNEVVIVKSWQYLSPEEVPREKSGIGWEKINLETEEIQRELTDPNSDNNLLIPFDSPVRVPLRHSP